MAILQMQRINIYALTKHCKGIIEALQRAGVMQVEKVDIEDNVFYKADTSSQQVAYKKYATTLRSATEILASYVNDRKSLFDSLKGRTVISTEDYYKRVDEYSSVLESAYSIIRGQKRITEYKAKIINYESRIESLKPWENFDLPIISTSTKFTTTVVGSFPERFDYESLRLAIANADSELEHFDIEIISIDENQTCVFVVCLSREYERLMTALRKNGFILPGVTSDVSATDAIKVLKEKIAKRRKLLQVCVDEIVDKKDMMEKFKFFEDYFTMKADQYAQLENVSYTPHTFVMTGYVTKSDGNKIANSLFEHFDAQVELGDAQGDNVPVVLSNSNFTEPVEGIVVSYSSPNRKEIDPTGVMAVFYYIFFGMMFSDAGYGLVMAIACGLGVKLFKNMEMGLRRSLRMFFWCGVSTFIWGLLFGSFFGDAVRVISDTFFGVQAPSIPGLTVPIWFNPTEGTGPTKLLMFSFLLGIIHLFTGLVMQAINYIRNGKILYAIYDDFSWILLVSGASLALLSTEMLASMAGFMLSSVWLTIGGIMAIVGAVLILFFSARNRNPFKCLIKGAYNLYGATGYLSDILSYSRLLALGLATGVVAQVFNQLGSMFGGGAIGVILFTLVFIIGHGLNIGINALGAYVHTNRLQFVEFFGKFYEGGGREFTPYAVKTKYYNIKEDI